jgi:hypothetical protein
MLAAMHVGMGMHNPEPNQQILYGDVSYNLQFMFYAKLCLLHF